MDSEEPGVRSEECVCETISPLSTLLSPLNCRIRNEHNKMRLLYFSPVAADSYAQRPHFMVRAWLEWGVRSVLWVNPHPCRLPRLSDLRRGPGHADQGSRRDPRIEVLNLPALPIEPLPLGAKINRIIGRGAWRKIEQFAAEGDTIIGIGRPSAPAAAAIEELPHSGSFYDAMDNFPEFHTGLSRRAMIENERAVTERADLVTASSTFLADKFIRRGLRVEKLLNACEDGEFGTRDEGLGTSAKPQAVNPQSPAPQPPVPDPRLHRLHRALVRLAVGDSAGQIDARGEV